MFKITYDIKAPLYILEWVQNTPLGILRNKGSGVFFLL